MLKNIFLCPHGDRYFIGSLLIHTFARFKRTVMINSKITSKIYDKI